MPDNHESEISVTRIERVLVNARRHGASIRSLAKCFGMSKSAMGRWVQMIEASHLGQHDENSPAISPAAQLPSGPNAAVSQGRG